MSEDLALELAVRCPWTAAEDGSLWIGSGRYHDGSGDTFRACLLRCVPRWMHGTEGVLFEVFVVGGVRLASASDITRAREVLTVWADDPLTAVDPDGQGTIDRALMERRGET